MDLSSAADEDAGVEVGGPELLIVLLVVVVIFGPSRITGLARSLGEAIHEFRAGQESPKATPEAPKADTKALEAPPADRPDQDADISAGEREPEPSAGDASDERTRENDNSTGDK